MLPAAAPQESREKPEFSGLFGWIVGVRMALGRGRSVRQLADVAGLQPGDRVLDVGCGPGNAVREAGARGAAAVGLDPSAVMLTLARRFTPAEAHPRVRYVEGSVDRLPFVDRSFTIVWSVASAHHWPDIPSGLAEIRRVVAPGGQALIAETLVRPRLGWTNQHGFTLERATEVAEQARAVGFETGVERYRVGRRDVVLIRGRPPDGG